jgi:hypothetical protein
MHNVKPKRATAVCHGSVELNVVALGGVSHLSTLPTSKKASGVAQQVHIFEVGVPSPADGQFLARDQ